MTRSRPVMSSSEPSGQRIVPAASKSSVTGRMSIVAPPRVCHRCWMAGLNKDRLTGYWKLVNGSEKMGSQFMEQEVVPSDLNIVLHQHIQRIKFISTF